MSSLRDACGPAEPTLLCSCGYPIPPALNPENHSCPAAVSGVAASREGSVSHAQQNSVIKLAPPKGKTEPTFLWTGDRWQSACRSTVIAQGVSPIGPDLGCVKAWVRQRQRRSLSVIVATTNMLIFAAVENRITSIGASWTSTTLQRLRCRGSRYGATKFHWTLMVILGVDVLEREWLYSNYTVVPSAKMHTPPRSRVGIHVAL